MCRWAALCTACLRAPACGPPPHRCPCGATSHLCCLAASALSALLAWLDAFTDGLALNADSFLALCLSRALAPARRPALCALFFCPWADGPPMLRGKLAIRLWRESWATPCCRFVAPTLVGVANRARADAKRVGLTSVSYRTPCHSFEHWKRLLARHPESTRAAGDTSAMIEPHNTTC